MINQKFSGVFFENINFRIFNSNETLTKDLALKVEFFLRKGLCVLPGGSTPKKLYQKISKNINNKNNKILLSDDRLVDCNDELSNFKMIKDNLIIDYDKNFPVSYFSEITKSSIKDFNNYLSNLFKINKLELALIGIGSDSHTASLFPGNAENLKNETYGFVLKNNNDNFSRFTLSYKAILKAEKIIFLLTGNNKSRSLYDLINSDFNPLEFPIHEIFKNHKNIEVYCDKSAASLIF
jgi:6-phosphogluconolactonase